MIFQNKTTYDRKTLEKLNQTVNWAVTNKSNPVIRILSMLIPLAILGSGFYVYQERGAIPIAIVELVLGGFLMLWIPFSHRWQAWMSSKLMLKGDPEYTVSFREGGYVVSSTTAYGQDTDEIPYSTFWRLCETSDYFVLLLNKRSGYILNKNGFVSGNFNDFRGFIQRKTGQQFERFSI